MDKSTTVNKLANYLSWLIALILAVMPFHAFLTVWLASLSGHYTALRLWKELLLLVLVAGTAYLLISDRSLRKRFIANRLVQLIIIYILVSIVWTAVAYGFNKVTPKALGYGLIVNLRFLVFFLTTWVVATKSQWLQQIWPKLVLIPAAVVVFVGLLQRLILPYDVLKHFGYSSNTIFPYETINHNVHYQRVMSTLRGANPLGAYLILILSAVTAVFIKSKKRRALLGVGALATLLVLFFSYSRGAWAGAVLALFFLAWAAVKNQRLKRLLLAGLAGCLVIGTVLVFALRHNATFENYFFHTDNRSSNSKISSNAGHASALRSGLRDIVHEPLGEGVGTAGPASIYNKNKARISENYFIQIGQEVGWLGLALFVAINYLVALELWARRGDTLAISLLAGFIGLTFAVNMLSHGWTDDTVAYIWWGLAGIALARPIIKKT